MKGSIVDPKDWNLLNAAQAVINKLTAAQANAMAADDTHWAEQYKGKINSPGRPTSRKLHKLGLIETPETLTPPTELGAKVRDVLRGRRRK